MYGDHCLRTPNKLVCNCSIRILFFIPKIWAKRVGQITAVIILAYAIKTFILFASCYAGICPEKKSGIFLVLWSAIFILAASLFTGVKLPEESKNQ